MPQLEEVFEPAPYSNSELAFLLAHLTETPNVALHGVLPKGVNPAAVRPALQRFSELSELQKIKNVPWVGYDAIRDSIERYLAYQDKCLSIQKSGGVRHPSMYSWDSTGAMYLGGIGSDSADYIRHELTDDGQRIPFAVNLVNPEKSAFKYPWVGANKESADRLRHDDEGSYFCTVCQKVVASYDIDGGRRARNKARAQAIKHAKTSKKELQRHRSLVTGITE